MPGKFNQIISLILLVFLTVSCSKDYTEVSSVTGSEVAELAATADLNQYTVTDEIARNKISLTTTAVFRQLPPKKLQEYNKKYKLKALDYLYDDDNAVALMVTPMGKLPIGTQQNFINTVKSITAKYPGSEFIVKSNTDKVLPAVAVFIDKANKTNNFCQFNLSNSQDLYNICLTSQKTAVADLKKILTTVTIIPGNR